MFEITQLMFDVCLLNIVLIYGQVLIPVKDNNSYLVIYM